MEHLGKKRHRLLKLLYIRRSNYYRSNSAYYSELKSIWYYILCSGAAGAHKIYKARKI